jgi:hypothetical protein
VIPDGSTISRSDRAVHRELADGAGVLLHLDSGAYYSLNEVALTIWRFLEEPIVFEDLMERLRTEIRDAPPDLETDVAEFLQQLRERDLIAIVGGD